MMFLFSKKAMACTMVLMTVILITTSVTNPVAGSSENEESLALTVLENVVGIDIEAYGISSFKASRGSLTQCCLTFASNKVEVLVQFIGGALAWCDIRALNGALMLKVRNHYVNELDAAKGLLERYQMHFNVPHCSKLMPLLDKIVALDENATVVTEGDVVLRVERKEEGVSFTWTPALNGTEVSRKRFSFFLGKNHIGFVDAWGITRIGSTEVNFSEKEAKNIALDLAEKWITKEGADLKIVRIETKFYFYNDVLTPRGGDPFTLYPSWRVTLYFDKTWKSCFAYGVAIWADTGEVRDADPQGFLGLSESQGPLLDAQTWIAVTMIPATLAIATIIYRKRSPRYMKTKRSSIHSP
jgi:hypothetical protein